MSAAGNRWLAVGSIWLELGKGGARSGGLPPEVACWRRLPLTVVAAHRSARAEPVIVRGAGAAAALQIRRDLFP